MRVEGVKCRANHDRTTHAAERFKEFKEFKEFKGRRGYFVLCTLYFVLCTFHPFAFPHECPAE